MARRKNIKNKREDKETENAERKARLHHETKKSIGALIFIGLGIIFVLARFNAAGPAGDLLYNSFWYLFGYGYYLVPLSCLIMAGVLLASERYKIYQITVLGIFLLVAGGLGIIELVFPEEGGLFGKLISSLKIPLGYTAALITLTILTTIAILITFNIALRVPRLRKEEGANDGDEYEEEIEETVEEALLSQEEEKPEKISAMIEEKTSLTKTAKPAPRQKTSFKNYAAPPLELLKSSVEKPTAGDLRANANIIKRTFESFGIQVEMSEINIGPKFTRYTLKPAEGIKLSRITALNQDLALALAAHPIRIEAPIPGKSLVGVEVPNKSAAIVRLGSLIAYPEFNASGLLGFSLGRDVSGEPIFADLEKMPHLLIAGSSGSGKSIAIHSLLVSLLYKNSPETLRLILIDPKRVELSIYENIPHLISPVIIHPKKSIAVFRWLIEEMNRRYEILLKSGSRDIMSYNKKKEEIMPYIVIVIDELADLMVTYGREVEGSIVRLAQMARATGLHLVVSTQRPSVEVVTGLIKANITSRIALQLPSQVDSRTILDTSGAEKLLGGGDMLFVSSELSKPKRIQGAFISEEEVNKVANFIRENNKEMEKEEMSFENGGAENGLRLSDETLDEYISGGDEDELLDEAIKVVVEARKASASLLQRRLKVGYARAARLLDIMESKGIIGPGEGAKPREVFKTKEESGF